jgi:integrase
MLASSVILPSRGSAPTTVAQLTELYAASLGSRSTRYAGRQESLLRHWVTPVIGDRPLVGWTPADSERVLDSARQRLAPATVQNVGACMRALVTFAYKNRWLARESDPMWLVRYSAHPDVQGQAVGFIPRASLPTDQDCQRLFDALESLDQPVWAPAMGLKHRSGARWRELIALRPVDLDFEPQRVVRIHRAVEQSARGMSIKTTKNRQQRVSTFPASLVADLRQRARDVDRAAGPQGLLFPGTNRGFANRRIFQRTWIRGAPIRLTGRCVAPPQPSGTPMTFATSRHVGCSSTSGSTQRWLARCSDMPTPHLHSRDTSASAATSRPQSPPPPMPGDLPAMAPKATSSSTLAVPTCRGVDPGIEVRLAMEVTPA